jgi:hypothetical protein
MSTRSKVITGAFIFATAGVAIRATNSRNDIVITRVLFIIFSSFP